MYNIEIMDDFAGKSENETMRVIPNITDTLICLKIFDTVNPKFEFNVCACRKILAIIIIYDVSPGKFLINILCSHSNKR